MVAQSLVQIEADALPHLPRIYFLVLKKFVLLFVDGKNKQMESTSCERVVFSSMHLEFPSFPSLINGWKEPCTYIIYINGCLWFMVIYYIYSTL